MFYTGGDGDAEHLSEDGPAAAGPRGLFTCRTHSSRLHPDYSQPDRTLIYREVYTTGRFLLAGNNTNETMRLCLMINYPAQLQKYSHVNKLGHPMKACMLFKHI